MKVLFAIEKLAVHLGAPLRATYTANKCGHRTKRKGVIRAGTDVTIMHIPLAGNGQPDYCIKCIERMTISCAWCGGSIAVGAPITLYTPTADFVPPTYAVRYTENGVDAVVGCLRSCCADANADRAGFWYPGENGQEMVRLTGSIYDAILGDTDATAGTIADVHDQVEAADPTIVR